MEYGTPEQRPRRYSTMDGQQKYWEYPRSESPYLGSPHAVPYSYSQQHKSTHQTQQSLIQQQHRMQVRSQRSPEEPFLIRKLPTPPVLPDQTVFELKPESPQEEEVLSESPRSPRPPVPPRNKARPEPSMMNTASGLTHARPRHPIAPRTPSLSMAGSSSSRASSVFIPTSPPIARSIHSGEGTDYSRNSYIDDTEMPTPWDKSISLSVQIPDPDPDSDLQRELDDFEKFARSLPSPLPGQGAMELEAQWRIALENDKLDFGLLQISDPPVPLIVAPAAPSHHIVPDMPSTCNNIKIQDTPIRIPRSTMPDIDATPVRLSFLESSDSEDEDDQDLQPFLRVGDVSDRNSEISLATDRRYLEGHGKIIDLSYKSLEGVEFAHDTTHLLLVQNSTPEYIPLLMARAISGLCMTLSVLDISYCGFEELPDTLCHLLHLRELDIKGNPLSRGILPAILGRLTALRFLIADSCGLVAMPYSLHSLTYLNTLSIRDNSLPSLPGWLARLPNLEVLLVDRNNFQAEWITLVQSILSDAPQINGFMRPEITHPAYSTRSSMFSVEGESTNWTDSSIGNSLRHVSSTTSLRTRDSSPALPMRIGESLPTSPQVELNQPITFDGPTSPPSNGKALKQFTANQSDGKRWGKVLKKGANMVSSFRKPNSRANSSTSEGIIKIFAPTESTEPVPALPTKPTSSPVSPPPSSDTTTSPVVFERNDRKSRRQNKCLSFLKLQSIPTLDTMISAGLESVASTPFEPDHRHKAALIQVLLYLRDLDDLTYDLPFTGVAPNNVPQQPSFPALRSTASSSSLTSGSIRRSPSTRKGVPQRPGRARANSFARSAYGDERPADEPAPMPTLPKLRVDPVRRDAVVEEIITTEKSYLKGLVELCTIYTGPAASAVGAGPRKESLIPLLERRAVFGNVEAIKDFHQLVFLPELEKAAKTSTPALSLANVFVTHGVFLKIYSSYINNFDDALSRLHTWTLDKDQVPKDSKTEGLNASQRKRIRAFLKRCKAQPNHKQISLEAYLLLPVQRIPRYRLLLESLLSCCAVEDSMNGGLMADPRLQGSLDLITKLATEMNERKRESEGRQQLLMWQQRIGHSFRSPLVQPHRTLIKQGVLLLGRTIRRNSSYVPSSQQIEDLTQAQLVHSLHTDQSQFNVILLLCTDLMVLLKEPPNSQDVNGPVQLFTVLRFSAPVGTDERPPPASIFQSDPTVLRLTCDSRAIFYFQCTSEDEAMTWMLDINKQRTLAMTTSL